MVATSTGPTVSFTTHTTWAESTSGTVYTTGGGGGTLYCKIIALSREEEDLTRAIRELGESLARKREENRRKNREAFSRPLVSAQKASPQSVTPVARFGCCGSVRR